MPVCQVPQVPPGGTIAKDRASILIQRPKDQVSLTIPPWTHPGCNWARHWVLTVGSGSDREPHQYDTPSVLDQSYPFAECYHDHNMMTIIK